MNRNLIVILTILIFLGCSKAQTEFQKAIEEYDQIKLPMTFNSNRDFDLKAITRDSIGSGGILYGRLFKLDNAYANIYLTIPVFQIQPHIFTQDNDGKIIDRFDFFKTTGKEPGWSSVEDYTIYPDKTFVFVDSTVTFEFTADSIGLNEIKGTKKLTVTKEKYKIKDNGKIEKIE